MSLTVNFAMFQEENESMPVKYELDIVQDFNIKGRVQALAISQETLLTSSPNVIQFTYASSNHKIYLCESGFKDTPEIKVTFGPILCLENPIYSYNFVQSTYFCIGTIWTY